MSLINQVLHDLDQRRAEGEGAARLPKDVRALPAATKSRMPWMLGGGLGVLALAGASWGVWSTWGPARPLPTVESVPVQVVMNTPLPALPAPEPVVVGSAAAPVALPSAPAIAVQASPVVIQEERLQRPAAELGRLPSLKLSGELKSAGAWEAPQPFATAPPAVVSESGDISKSPAESTPQERAERLYRAATSMLAQGRRDDGLTTLRAALREDPAHVAARQVLIRFYLDVKAWDAAQGVLRDGLNVLPKQSGWPMLLARLLLDRNDPAAAFSVLEKHEPYSAYSADYQAAMGATLQRLNRLSDAELRFTRATDLEPANGRWWLGLGWRRLER